MAEEYQGREDELNAKLRSLYAADLKSDKEWSAVQITRTAARTSWFGYGGRASDAAASTEQTVGMAEV